MTAVVCKRKIIDFEDGHEDENMFAAVKAILPDALDGDIAEALKKSHKVEDVVSCLLENQKESAEDASYALALQMQEEFGGPQHPAKKIKETHHEPNEDEDKSFALALQLQEESSAEKPPMQKQSAEDDASLALALKLQEDLNKGVAAKTCYMIPLEHGVVLFKNCLNIDQQLGIYNQCLELSESRANLYNTNTYYGTLDTEQGKQCRKLNLCTQIDQKPLPSVLMSINWKQAQSKQKLPDDLVVFARETFEKGKKNIKENASFYDNLPKNLKPPQNFNPEALQAILYPDHGSLGAHLDAQPGWVLSVSVGASAVFTFSDQGEPLKLGANGQYVDAQVKAKQEIIVESGDVLLFNGRAVWHAIERIKPGTAPAFWGKEVNDFGFSRFNLQFRDPNASW